ncbi:MAG: aminotransferase class IV [Bacteroidota bacterium]|nr:aminotransferase class IV [Bacteroidota bacterium]
MFQFIESIYIKNGLAPLISYHQARYQACLHAHFPNAKHIELKTLLANAPIDNQVYKLRIVYSNKIDGFEFIPYHQKKITSLVVIEDKSINYQWKYANRNAFDNLKANYSKDTELIITQNGLITDSSYSNLVLEKEGKRYTPVTPLLNGVQRQFLLDHRCIIPKAIHKNRITDYDSIYLINAMQNINNCIKLNTDSIIL